MKNKENWIEENIERLHKEFWENTKEERDKYVKDEWEIYKNEN